jgi:DNA-binding NtrC family response regulator
MPDLHALLIEDDDELRQTLSTGLNRAGYEVSVAAGGTEGLEQFSSAAFDVVVTDILMKDGEGIETLQHMKKNHPGVPVIGISGNPMYLQMFSKLGGYGTLQKPFRVATLVDLMNEATESR